MKYLPGLLFLLTILSACKKESATSELIRSRAAWERFKNASGNSYSYTAVSSSAEAGSTDSTVIAVNNGTVTGRIYKRYSINGQTGQRSLMESWVENLGTLNSHPNGAGTLNLDNIYEKAGSVWLKADLKMNTIYFEAKNQGMISKCGYVPKDCADDCFNGITISEISKKLATS